MSARKIKHECIDAPHRCPSFHDHTPCPSGFIEWDRWAKEMMKTHEQILCTGCGLYRVWVPRASRSGSAS